MFELLLQTLTFGQIVKFSDGSKITFFGLINFPGSSFIYSCLFKFKGEGLWFYVLPVYMTLINFKKESNVFVFIKTQLNIYFDKFVCYRLHYEITGGNVRGRFALTTQNGRGLITIAQPLDFKQEKRFILTVSIIYKFQ